MCPVDAVEPSESANTMEPEQVLQRLRKGQVVENVRISRLRLQGTFSEPVRFRNCLLVRPVFEDAKFEHEVQLLQCTLDRPTFNRKTEFAGGLDLSGSTLVKVQFLHVTFANKLTLANVVTRHRFDMNHCQVHARVNGWEASFTGWANLKNTVFTEEFDVRSAQFEQGVVFQDCVFSQDFILRGTVVAKKFDAANSEFAGLIDLSKAKLNDFVYLENIVQKPGQQFAIWNALGDRIIIRPDQVDGRLQSETCGDYARAMQEYGLLRRCFETQHRYDFEDWAFYRFKVCQRRGCGRTWWRPWTKLTQFFDWLFLDLGCGYGTNPLRAIRAGVLIVLVFALIYASDIQQFGAQKAPLGGSWDQWGNRLIVGLFVSVSIFTSGMNGIEDMAEGWINLPMIIEALMGILLFGLFIVAFSRKVIR